METRVGYGVKTRIRPECLRAYWDGWAQPTADEIRALLQITGLSGSQASKLVGIAEGRTVRRWTGGESPIPYAAWAILCNAAGYGVIWQAPPKQVPSAADSE